MMDHWEIMDLYKALFAIAAGLVLGLERELKEKAAGLKTITVICLGSALFTILSYKLGLADRETTRIASYIVSGIGFIGAGVIFKDRIDVSGLTTAGIIWLAAAVGMAIGYGEFYLSLTFVAAAMFIIFTSRWINKVLQSKRQSRMLTFELNKNNEKHRMEIFETIRKAAIFIEEKKLEMQGDKIIVTVDVAGPLDKMPWLEDYLIHHESVLAFSL